MVLQCGADSLSGDKLGTNNMTISAHGQCVEFVKSWNLPLMLLGGGGYTIKNVARCWAYETGIAVGSNLHNNIPVNDFYEFYGPDFTLHYKPSEEFS